MRLIPKLDFIVGHLLIQRVSAVRFIDNDAVVGVDTWRVIRHEDAFDHGLHRRYLDAGFSFGGHVAQFCDIVDPGQWRVLLQRGFVEKILRLLAQCIAIHEEQDAFKPLGLEETVHQTNDGAGLACTGGHGEKAVCLIAFQGVFDGTDGLFLIIPQFEIFKAFLPQHGLGGFLAARQLIQQPFRTVEIAEYFFQVGWSADIPEPGARLFSQLANKGSTIAGIDKGDFIGTVFSIAPSLIFPSQPPCGIMVSRNLKPFGITLGLRDFSGHIGILAFGFHHRNRG